MSKKKTLEAGERPDLNILQGMSKSDLKGLLAMQKDLIKINAKKIIDGKRSFGILKKAWRQLIGKE